MVMARVEYTAEQLLKMRGSPLVSKPDALPSIDQWLDLPQENTQRKPRPQNGRADDSGPMGNFGSQRPSLLQTRQVRVSNGGEIMLGPPKTAFASSGKVRKTTETDQKDENDFSLETMASRTRSMNEDESGRRRGNENRDDKEGWTHARGNREKDRQGGRNFRDRNERSAQEDGENARGNGTERRLDQRWPRNTGDDRRERLPTREGGWRDREKRNDRDAFKDNAPEKEPEWMDEPVEHDEPAARTAEEFEKWKAKMRGQTIEPTPEPAAPEKSPAVAKTSVPLLPDEMFGTWGEQKRAASSGHDETPPTVPAASKKASRFASMFAPKEESRPAEPQPSPLPMHPSEDQQGFQRMLMKLRATSVQPQDSPTGVPPPGLYPGMTPGQQSYQSDHGGLAGLLGSNSSTSKANGGPAKSRPPSGFDPLSAFQQPSPLEVQQSPRHQRQDSQGPPPRKDTSTPESKNIHNLLAAQRTQKGAAALSKDSEFLLNLIQTKSANRGPQQTQLEHDPNFQLFLDQPPRAQTQQPQAQPRPPGFPPGHEPMFSPGPNSQDGPHIHHTNHTQAPPGFFDDRGHPQGPPQQRRPPGFGPPEGFFSPEEMRFHQGQPPSQDRNNGPPPPGFMRGPHGLPPNAFPHQPPQHAGHAPNQGGLLPHLMHQQRGPPGLPPMGEQGFPGMPPPNQQGQQQGGGNGIVPPPGFMHSPAFPPGAPPGFGGMQPRNGGMPLGLNIGPGPGQGPNMGGQFPKSPIEGMRSPVEGLGGFGRGR